MSTIKSSGQSYLESQGIEARKEQTARSDYNQNNQYSETHPDALASSGKGKGTGDYAGHGWTVPDMTKSKDDIAHTFFNSDGAGNSCDQKAREVMTARNLYGPENRYYLDVKIDTSANVADGQYDSDATNTRSSFNCPVV